MCTKRTAASCFFLEDPCLVDRCCSCTALLSKCTPKDVLSKCTLKTCYPSAHSECAIQMHTQNGLSKCTPKNVLSKCTLRTCYPSAHSERAIQVHTQERAIQVHTQERTIQVHTQECAIQVHGMLVHPCFLNCRGTSRCLAVGTSYSRTQLHSERAIQVHTQNVLSK